MARIYKKSASLEAKFIQYDILYKAGIVIAAIGFLLHLRIIVFHKFFLGTPYLPLFIFMAGGMIVGKFMGKRNAMKAGIDAEKKTEKIVSKLPDEYTGFANARITYDGRTSEVDMIVTGPNGVFVIETKSRKGYVYGDVDSKYLSQEKGRVETYVHKFYNPIKQVGTHVFRLSGFLKNQGIDAWVQGMVYFSEADLDLTGRSKIPYFDNETKLIDCILRQGSRAPLTADMLSKINQVIMYNTTK